MKAYTKLKYGGPEILQLGEIDKPSLKEDSILVKVKANSVNPADWHILRGKPFIARFVFGMFKPKNKIPGADFAGIVEEVGQNVQEFKAGDRVFGEALKHGSFAEYICVPESSCAIMAEGVDFPEMACVPIAGLTALQALITHGKLKEGESVLINGASGGVGHFAVQIAKARGAKVVGVCSSKSMDFAKALGADKVIAYDKEDIHHHSGKYNLILDAYGNLTYKDYKRMGQRGVLVGFTTMSHMIKLLFKTAVKKFNLIQFTAKTNTEDLEKLASLIRNKTVKVHIEKTYPYTKIPEAVNYIETMHTKGKVAMVWGNPEKI